MQRRTLLGAAGAAAMLAPAAALAKAMKPFAPFAGPRCRVVYVNDLSGDVDGLFATVHMILSTSVDLRAIVGTGTNNTMGPTASHETAARSVELGNEMLRLMKRAGTVPVLPGCDGRLPADGAPQRTAGVQAIIDEAMRTDSKLPLYVAVGGGLTEVAAALKLEPAIASRFTLVWIGGDALPGGGTDEANFTIDPLAARHVWNETEVHLWQVPRAVYSTCVVSAHELQARVAPHGAIGPWLMERLDDISKATGGRLNTGATWTLGDNPLVMLTALADWVPSSYLGGRLSYERFGTSPFDEVVAPMLDKDGRFVARETGRKIRVFRAVDTRTMFADMFAKLEVAFPAR